MARDPDRCDVLCLDVPMAEAVRSRMPSVDELGGWSSGARALGDPTRLAVAVALRESRRACVCDLGWIVGRDEKLVSHHVRRLKLAGLASSAREGKMVMYELTARGRALVDAIATRPVEA
jgi:DNA-binding transcriptional ArsR family regulator